MINQTINGLRLFKFEALAQFADLRHAVFSRQGGFSRGPYAGLNTSLGVGDDKADVQSNRRAVAACFDHPKMTYPRQVHGTMVLSFSASAAPARQNGHHIGDALITNEKNRFLTIQVADCQPILLYDPSNQAVANIHAGWRGTIQDIIARTIAMMKSDFGTSATDLVAGIGPSLGPCCAEFVNYQKEFPRRYWTYGDSRRHFDFWHISRDQLMAAGVAPQNIHISNLCTRCRTDLFFSYRGERVTGRFAAVIGLV